LFALTVPWRLGILPVKDAKVRVWRLSAECGRVEQGLFSHCSAESVIECAGGRG